MRVTTKIIWDMESGKVLAHDFYEYDGVVDLACSSGGQTAANDATQQANSLALSTALSQDYAASFAENQNLLSTQNAKLNYLISNPLGLSPQDLHTATTSINESTAASAKQALSAAASFASTHGGSADISGGGSADLAASLASSAALSKSQQLTELSQQDQALKRQSMFTGLEGLKSVGAGYAQEGSTA